MDVCTFGQGELRGEQPDCARAEHEHRLPRLECGGADGAQGVASGLDEGRGGEADVLGDLEREACRDDHVLREGAGPVTADPDLRAVRADVVVAGQAALAVAAPEHRVAGNTLADPRGILG
jgi:hypothetical protein